MATETSWTPEPLETMVPEETAKDPYVIQDEWTGNPDTDKFWYKEERWNQRND